MVETAIPKANEPNLELLFPYRWRHLTFDDLRKKFIIHGLKKLPANCRYEYFIHADYPHRDHNATSCQFPHTSETRPWLYVGAVYYVQ